MEQDTFTDVSDALDLSPEAVDYLMKVPDELMQRWSFTMPWQYNTEENNYRDPDKGVDAKSILSRKELQNECWSKFNVNPQVSTAIRGMVGRLTGWGFLTTSYVYQIQEEIENIEQDPRNRLYNYWPKYVGRAFIEGELFLLLTLHPNGFVEVDFMEPKELSAKGTDGTGIYFHPNKTFMPLFYSFGDKNSEETRQIPSIFIARYPELVQVASKLKGYDRSKQQTSRSRKNIYKKFGGYSQFIISWDRGFMTRRNVSYLRTILEWLNHYENLKKYEIDHKKSSGAYIWVFEFEDARAFKLWLGLSDTERRNTAIMAKMTPGAKIVLPPGMKLTAQSPQLPSITDQDTDILQMVSSGLNEPEDVMTGAAKGTFATVKASRGPMSDRTSDEIAYFDRFLKYDFWGSIFFLKSAIGKFPAMINEKRAIAFDEKQDPVFKDVPRRPEQLIDIDYPVSESIDIESRAKGLLGSKHGPVAETLGIPNSEVSSKVGFPGYGAKRLQKATEDDRYPELIYNADAESIQEKVEGEPKKPTNKKENK